MILFFERKIFIHLYNIFYKLNQLSDFETETRFCLRSCMRTSPSDRTPPNSRNFFRRYNACTNVIRNGEFDENIKKGAYKIII